MGRGRGAPGGRLYEVGDRSWMRWAKCPICGQRYCVNNNADHEVRPLRILGVAICARCFFTKGGSERLVKMYKVTRDLARLYELGHDDPKAERKRLGRMAWEAMRG